MAGPTTAAPQLQPDEWELLARLLENKQRELLAEIRHTTKRAFREALHKRLDQVEQILSKIPRAAGVAAE